MQNGMEYGGGLVSDDAPTARQTPQSKSFAPGLESCPCCNRTGIHLGVQCLYCEGGRVVPIAKADKWRAAHRDTDPAPPDGDGGRKC